MEVKTARGEAFDDTRLDVEDVTAALDTTRTIRR
jgi:hypothetical protein